MLLIWTGEDKTAKCVKITKSATENAPTTHFYYYYYYYCYSNYSYFKPLTTTTTELSGRECARASAAVVPTYTHSLSVSPSISLFLCAAYHYYSRRGLNQAAAGMTSALGSLGQQAQKTAIQMASTAAAREVESQLTQALTGRRK